MKYEVVIGLEVHVELKTRSKIFCSCRNGFTNEPNIHCCPGCAGFPGTLPVLNREVMRLAARAGMALHCQINPVSRFERKHYFYPDLPESYQITQNETPLCVGGYVELETDEGVHRVRIHHIHVEEDAGKLLHVSDDTSLCDFNRVAVPLIEIVTEPDMRSSAHVAAFLEHIKSTMQYLDVSDCKMEEGSLRCDVNISVRVFGASEFGVRTEMKNINSFKAAVRAVQYESKRHIDMLENGETVKRETRRWDDVKGMSFAMRTKEMANDYRYFPEPNVPLVVMSEAELKDIRQSLVELAPERKARFIASYGLSAYDAGLLSQERPLADFFEDTLKYFNQPKTVANWILSDILRLMKERGALIQNGCITSEKLASLLTLVDDGVINITVGKSLLEEIFGTELDPAQLVKERGLAQISDEGALSQMVRDIIAANPAVVQDYKNGKEKALTFFVGQVMKQSKGKANPKVVNALVLQALSEA